MDSAPPALLSSAVEAVEAGAERFHAKLDLLLASVNEDVHAEVMNLVRLSLRHIEGVTSLAKTRLELIPAGHAAARASIEVVAKAAWISDDNLISERRLRWIAHLDEETRVYERSAKGAQSSSAMAHEFGRVAKAHAASVSRIRADICETAVAPSIPTAKTLLESAGSAKIYPLYIYMSQFVHGGHSATWQFRGGTDWASDKLAEAVSLGDWAVPICASWYVFEKCANRALWRVGMREKSCLPTSLAVRIREATAKLADYSTVRISDA
jgi:hypothetical protein